MSAKLQELLAIMARLRGPGGCPWDREQTFASIAPHAIEEAYEVADAAERGDLAHLREELGDLLFQVVFHAQMASEAGQFDFDAVAAAIAEKLIRRHPHVFGDGAQISSAEQSQVWEDVKAQERGAGRAAGTVSHLDDVPRGLPALMRAYKLSKRAARTGFDFEAAGAAADKVAEELAEVRAAALDATGPAAAALDATGPAAAALDATGPAAAAVDATAPAAAAALFEEVGDLLFAAANLARKLGIDAEAALRAANGKFERRFRGMEELAAARGVAFDSLGLEAQEALWQEMKRSE
jgi:MazG family protein